MERLLTVIRQAVGVFLKGPKHQQLRDVCFSSKDAGSGREPSFMHGLPESRVGIPRFPLFNVRFPRML